MAATSSYAIVSLIIGSLQLLLVVVVLRRLGRFGRSFPWLVALMLFFAIRGADRIYHAYGGDDRGDLALAADAMLVAVLVLLIGGLDRTVRGLEAAQTDADWREREYRRALHDYRTLARHRLANPLAAIEGSAQTLRELEDLDAETRAQLLDVIAREAKRLETIALDPAARDPSERQLDPRPRV